MFCNLIYFCLFTIQAAVERAKQLREERKNGINEAESHSFTPQLNKRPSYLSSKPDSLDKLASEVVLSDDIFEKPLPGKKAYDNTPSEIPPVPSPGSDALGREMKRFPGDSVPKATNIGVDKNRNGVNPQIKRQTEDDPDENFMNNLRSDSHGNRNGPGWNDDITTDGGFDAFKNGKKGGGSSIPKPSRRALLGQKQEQPSDYTTQFERNQYQQQQQQQQNKHDTRSAALAQSDWNSDTDIVPMATATKITPRKDAPQQRNELTELDGTAIRQARSKLSLLKSKIRQSESGNATLRSQSLTRSGSSETFSNTSKTNDSMNETGDSMFGNGRKTAPLAMGQDDGSYNDDFNQSNGIADRSRKLRSQVPRKAAPPDDGYRQQQQQQQQQQSRYETPRLNRNQPSKAGFDGDDHYQFHHQKSTQQRSQPQQERNPPSREQPPSNSYNKRQPPLPSQDSDDEDQDLNRGRGNASRAPVGIVNNDNDNEDGDGQPQMECPDCGRKFNSIPFQKHIKICAKVFVQKRKVFDSQKMRIQDNPELVNILTKAQKDEKRKAQRAAASSSSSMAGDGFKGAKYGGGGGGFGNEQAQGRSQQQQIPVQQQVAQGRPNKPAPAASDAGESAASKAAKWKEQSEAFRAAMKAAKQFSKAVATGGPLPPPVISAPDSSLVPCPHCGRRFNEKAADRHIPQCQNIIAKPSSLKKGAGGGGGINGTLAVKTKTTTTTKGKR